MQPLPDDSFLAAQDDRDAGEVSPEVRLMLAVVLALTADIRTRHEPIRVGAQNSVVLLSGEVSSWTVRAAAAEVVRSDASVSDVCNQLRVSHGLPAPDAFDLLAGSFPPPPRPAQDLVGLSLLAFLWLALPLTVMVTGLPVVPVVLIAAGVTLVALTVRRRR